MKICCATKAQVIAQLNQIHQGFVDANEMFDTADTAVLIGCGAENARIFVDENGDIFTNPEQTEVYVDPT